MEVRGEGLGEMWPNCVTPLAGAMTLARYSSIASRRIPNALLSLSTDACNISQVMWFSTLAFLTPDQATIVRLGYCTVQRLVIAFESLDENVDSARF